MLSTVGCGGSEASGPRPIVFAAASMADVLVAAGRAFAEQGGAPPRFSFAASSTLARQVEAGAPAELVVVADPAWMDQLERAGRMQPGTRVDLAGGRLVWITAGSARGGLDVDWDAPGPPPFEGRLALGDPEHVPAGIYARQALRALGWWDSVRARLAPAADVRAALRLVELGEAGAGLVYATDARASERVHVVGVVPSALSDPIRYSAALVSGAGEDAAAFLAFLRGTPGQRLLADYGFMPAEEPGTSRGGD